MKLGVVCRMGTSVKSLFCLTGASMNPISNCESREESVCLFKVPYFEIIERIWLRWQLPRILSLAWTEVRAHVPSKGQTL